MQEKGIGSANAVYLTGANLDRWWAPSLRYGAGNGLGAWAKVDIAALLKTDRNGHGVVFGSMMEAFNNSTQFMTDDDLKSIAVYLKSLPQAAEPVWAYDAATMAKFTSGGATDAAADIFLRKCSYCHGRDGKGRGEFLPPLAGAFSLVAAAPDSVMNIILNGASRVVANGVPDSYRIPAFYVQLRDEDVAAVASFVRQAWGNTGTPVTAAEVKDLRDRTNPSSDRVIVLQMR